MTHERFIDNPCERFLLIFIIFEILGYCKKGLDQYPASQKGNVSYRATSLTDVGATVVVRLVVHEQHVSKRHSQDRLLARASMVQVQNNRKPSDRIFFRFMESLSTVVRDKVPRVNPRAPARDASLALGHRGIWYGSTVSEWGGNERGWGGQGRAGT